MGCFVACAWYGTPLCTLRFSAVVATAIGESDLDSLAEQSSPQRELDGAGRS